MARKKNICHILALSYICFMLTCTSIMAQQDNVDDLTAGRLAGEQDARINVNGQLWFFAGCCLGATGLIIAYLAEPSPRTAPLMGKPMEYIYGYTDAYKATGRNIQTNNAWKGCGVSVAVNIAFYVVYFYLLATTDYYYY